MVRNFLDLPPELSDPLRARAVVLPVPLEKTTSYWKGTARGPQAIIEASAQVEFFDMELGVEPCSVGIATDRSLAQPSLNERPVEEILEAVRDKVSGHLSDGRFVLALGGEHTITVGTVDPFISRFAPDLTVVAVDAHADLRDRYQGTPLSHACAMRRILGRAPIVSVGIRSMDREEAETASEGGVKIFAAHEIRRNPRWAEEVIGAIGTRHVYLTFDVDGLDPSVVPSVGTPEPGGLEWYETLRFLRMLGEQRRIVGADVNELCPGPLHQADYAVAKLCYKILAYSFQADLKTS